MLAGAAGELGRSAAEGSSVGPVVEFDKLLPPATRFVEGNPCTLYWVRDGKVSFRHYPLQQADAATFGFYLGCFAVDAKSCYCTNSRLTKADPATFRCLNYTFYKDRSHVWTMFGEVKKADAASFTAADTGVVEGYGTWHAFGFGKDTNGVYYVGLYGYMGWLPDVDPGSFISCGDGHLGYDRAHVYCGNKKLPKARPESWAKIGGMYSRDGDRVYCLNQLVKGADPDSFWVEPGTQGRAARDKARCYLSGVSVEAGEFEAQLRHHAAPGTFPQDNTVD
jgi:hypothetical protein